MEYWKNEIPALWQTHTYKRAYSIILLHQKKKHPLSKEEKNNQRPMGHICSPEKNFQPVNTFTQSYEYTIKLIKRENLLTFLHNWELNDPYLQKREFPSP